MTTLSVVIPTWNNADWTIRCLTALERNTEADLHIVWIDNGSEPDQHEAARTAVQRFDHDMERHPEPLGFARATNRGLPLVRGRYTVFLNNDVEVYPGWDIELRRAVDDAPGAAGPVVVGPTVGHQGVECHPWLGVPDAITNPEDAARFLTEPRTRSELALPPHGVWRLARNMDRFEAKWGRRPT